MGVPQRPIVGPVTAPHTCDPSVFLWLLEVNVNPILSFHLLSFTPSTTDTVPPAAALHVP